MGDDERRQLDEQVRLAVDSLPPAPVRWDLVARKARRRRLIGAILLVALSLALVLAIATGLLAGKSALDPTYSPPLVSKDSVRLEFDEPDLGYGLTPLVRYAAELPSVDSSGLPMQSLGYVFNVNVQGAAERDDLVARWKLRRRGSPQSLPIAMHSGEMGLGSGESDGDDTYSVWVKQPRGSGQFVVDVSVIAAGDVLARESSAPIHVVRGNSFSRYEAPTYVAKVPRGWRLVSDYENEPGRRFVTKLYGPHGISVLIDTTLETRGDPADSARRLETLFREGEESYRRLSFTRKSFGGPVLEWSFLTGNKVLTDIFFFRGGDGYAVLAESDPRYFREARLAARLVARSVEGKS